MARDSSLNGGLHGRERHPGRSGRGLGLGLGLGLGFGLGLQFGNGLGREGMSRGSVRIRFSFGLELGLESRYVLELSFLATEAANAVDPFASRLASSHCACHIMQW